MMKKTKLLFLILILTLLVGCGPDIQQNLTIDNAGKGTREFVLTFDESAVADIKGRVDNETLDLVALFNRLIVSELPEWVTVKEDIVTDEKGQVVSGVFVLTYPFDSLEDYNEKTSHLINEDFQASIEDYDASETFSSNWHFKEDNISNKFFKTFDENLDEYAAANNTGGYFFNYYDSNRLTVFFNGLERKANHFRVDIGERKKIAPERGEVNLDLNNELLEIEIWYTAETFETLDLDKVNAYYGDHEMPLPEVISEGDSKALAFTLEGLETIDGFLNNFGGFNFEKTEDSLFEKATYLYFDFYPRVMTDGFGARDGYNYKITLDNIEDMAIDLWDTFEVDGDELIVQDVDGISMEGELSYDLTAERMNAYIDIDTMEESLIDVEAHFGENKLENFNMEAIVEYYEALGIHAISNGEDQMNFRLSTGTNETFSNALGIISFYESKNSDLFRNRYVFDATLDYSKILEADTYHTIIRIDESNPPAYLEVGNRTFGKEGINQSKFNDAYEFDLENQAQVSAAIVFEKTTPIKYIVMVLPFIIIALAVFYILTKRKEAVQALIGKLKKKMKK